MIFLAPSLDPQTHGGIERVSRQVVDIYGGLQAPGDLALVSNDPRGLAKHSRSYGRQYFSMVLDAMRMPLDGLTGPILCMHAGLSPVARILARRMKKPYVVFLHGVEVWRRLPIRTRWGLAKAGLLISNSRFTWSKFREWYPVLADKPSVVVPLGLWRKLDELKEQKPAGFDHMGRFVLSVGRLSLEDDYKGHGTLIHAISELRQNCPDVSLVLAGGGNATQFLKRLAGKRNDPEAVAFAGSVSDAELLWLYRNCSVFAMLSEGEGFGLVHIEAMAQGRPCLGTHADAAAEIIQDGVTGRLVPAREPAAAAEALRQMLRDPVELRAMGERALYRVKERYLQKHFAERLRNALSSIS